MSRNTKTILIAAAIVGGFVIIAVGAIWLLSPFFQIANVVNGGK